MSYTDYPKSASNNAKRALKYKEESGNPKGCGTPVGWRRATQLANREPISEDVVKRMASFNRHRQHKDVPYDEGCGGLMWDAWGGTSGVDWAIRKSKQIDEEKMFNAILESDKLMKAEADELSVGDFVSWNSSGGRARGKITKIERDGSIDVPGSSFTITGTEDDPAVLIQVYRGGEASDVYAGHRASTLTKINPIKSMNPFITKKAGILKDVDVERRMIEGYYSVFDYKDSDGDIMMKGCYTKTIKENGPNGKNRIMHLYQHDPLTVLGKPSMLVEDEKGLYFRTAITDTQLGTDVLKLYRDGVLKEHSVGINFVRRDFSNEDEAYIVNEVKMWEGSTVTWGANEMALGGMAKGSQKDQVDQYKTLVRAFDSGDYTDETFMLIEMHIKNLEEALRKSLQNTEAEPITSVSNDADFDAIFKQFNNQLQIEKEFKQWT
jgi:HK97 family phage prohead protease